MNAPGTLDREETLHTLYLAIDGQERKAEGHTTAARAFALAGDAKRETAEYKEASRYWAYKAGMVQAAEAIGFTYLELFGVPD